MTTQLRTFPRRWTARRNSLLLLCVVLVAGCATASSARNPFDPSDTRGGNTDEPLRIEVQNLNFNDVTIWAMRQGQRIRLGRVTGKTDETFRIDWNMAVPISFAIDVTGGRSCGTGTIGVERNATVWIAVPASVGAQPCRVGRR